PIHKSSISLHGTWLSLCNLGKMKVAFTQQEYPSTSSEGMSMNSDCASVSRRKFLASSAAAVAIGTGMVRADTPPEKTVGFALVGIGTLSMGQILPAFA